MKQVLHLLFTFLMVAAVGSTTQAQIGIGTNSPHASAQLDVSSTTKGFLPPRMNTNGRNAIVAPAAGLIIYNTDLKTIECFNGTAWYSNVHYVGQSYGGGIVFYVYNNGRNGLIAAVEDQNRGYWSSGMPKVTMAHENAVYGGLKNTILIVANEEDGAPEKSAADVCNEYSITINGVTYGDWYLPSKYELELLYNESNMVGGVVDNFEFDSYWSSTEIGDLDAFGWDFNMNAEAPANKQYNLSVRAIRAF